VLARIEVDTHDSLLGATRGPHICGPDIKRRRHEKVARLSAERPETPKAPRARGFRECAEEDSNLHPVIPDQALNLVTRLSDPFDASRTSIPSTDLDGMDAMEDLDVATDVATSSGTANRRRPLE
jgi:hypothetical protein